MRNDAGRASILTSLDAERLKHLVEGANHHARSEDWLEYLQEELDTAKVVRPELMPPDIITINSRVILEDLESGEKITYVLVMPREADIHKCQISILAPIGRAILGRSINDIIEFKTPGGLRCLKVTGILYQPESAGDYHL